MLSISLYRNKISFIESRKKKHNLLISEFDFLKYDNYDKVVTNSLKDVVSKRKFKKYDNKVCFIIDSQFCHINEIFCEDEKGLDFRNELSGINELSKYMESYYYPINTRDDHYIGIHVNKNIKAALISAASKQNLELSKINVGVFSADLIAKNVFDANKLDNYLIIRFITSNFLEVLYIDDGILMLYGTYRISKSNISPMNIIGNRENHVDIISLLKGLVENNAIKNQRFNRVFVYQTSGHSPIIKNIINNKQEDFMALNLFSKLNSGKGKSSITEIFNQLSYADHGQIFRGLNV